MQTAPASARVAVDTVRGQALVIVKGEFDLATTDVLSAALEQACQSGHDVLLDVRDVDFMDISALHALVQAEARLGSRRRGFAIRNAHGVVRRLLDVSGLGHLIVAGG